ncbi:MAG: helix-turn-helix transcriptional regulator [Clostridia bacterium]|nr:helix-turn-helix transcriptional regulator [Clostridia bacterium]
MNGLEFRDILKNFLKENDLTQTKFASIVGIKQSQVSEWLKGKAKPGYDILKQMSKAFGVSADFWLGLTNEY